MSHTRQRPHVKNNLHTSGHMVRTWTCLSCGTGITWQWHSNLPSQHFSIQTTTPWPTHQPLTKLFWIGKRKQDSNGRPLNLYIHFFVFRSLLLVSLKKPTEVKSSYKEPSPSLYPFVTVSLPFARGWSHSLDRTQVASKTFLLVHYDASWHCVCAMLYLLWTADAYKTPNQNKNLKFYI